MSQSVPILSLTYTAAADYRECQGCSMYLSAAGVVTIASTTSGSIGILANKPNIGEPAHIIVLGTAKVRAEGGFSIGDKLAVASADGKHDTASTAVQCVAIALEAASAEDNLVEALLCNFWTKAT